MTVPTERWIAVGEAESLKLRTTNRLRVEGVDLLLIWHAEKFRACERACPHELADLALGRIAGGRIHCPHHMASFDLTNGKVSPGWSCGGLLLYPVRVEDGQVWIFVPKGQAAT